MLQAQIQLDQPYSFTLVTPGFTTIFPSLLIAFKSVPSRFWRK